ncbi:MAG: 4Fe-4S dicluster domain-containing protein, partial [Deltaproteobacteria bacterium]|nr:4Fe-4S dicluster domain-containing protein [Deltaproteobacteria bacterium]
ILLLMHALEDFVSSELFTDYSSTMNPFMFLRDLLGAMVILGIALAIYRRFFLKTPRLNTNAMDRYAIIILAVVMLSGIFLESTKIMSHSRFQEMVDAYGDPDNEEEVKALEAYWVKDFSLVSPNIKGALKNDILEPGEEAHEMNCAGCHSRPHWAFLGYGATKIIKPFALGIDQANLPAMLWVIHFLACWIGLAYLPFSKMFHILASPLSLLSNSVMEDGKSNPANIATRQILELDACTHCCTCTLNCSAGAFYEYFSNTNILPSEKIISIKALASGKELSRKELKDIQEGICICTNCKRCTVVCPAGINLQDLWYNTKETLLKRDYPELLMLSPFSFYRGVTKKEGDFENYERPLNRAREAIAARCDSMEKQDEILSMDKIDRDFKDNLKVSDQAQTFMVCFGCETCTTVCPVVANYDKPVEVLGLLPHQIMHVCGLGMKGLALGSNMLWDCLTCYKCQEQCPQGVGITDVFYELKNEAVKYVNLPGSAELFCPESRK